MIDTLKGKKVAIFGAYGFVGSAIVEAAAAQDARITAVGRNEAKLKELTKRIDGAVSTTLFDPDMAPETVRFGEDGIDAVIVTFGGELTMTDFADITAAEILEQIRAKLTVQVAAVQSILPSLTPDAAIILFSGLLSRKPVKGLSALTAVNGALEAMTRSMALELAPRRVNCISPAMIKPASERGDDLTATTPEEVAALALSLIGLNVSGATFDIPRDPALM